MIGRTAGPDDLVLSTRTLRGAGFHSRVEAAAASGWRFIGIDERDYAAAVQEGLDDRGIAKLLSANGLAVSEVEMLGDWAHGGERGRRSRALEDQLLGIAATFGARQLNVGRDVEGPPDHVARRLAELARRAAVHGVLVALEFMPFANIADGAAAWHLVRAADEPGVGILLDTWHLRRCETTDAQLREIPADRIVSVQLADTGPRAWPDLRQEALTDRRLPGEGAGEIPALLAVLDAHGVRAPVSVEVMSRAMEALTPAAAAAEAMRAARAVFHGWGHERTTAQQAG